MKNPWEDIPLSDYEDHMSLDSVMQLQAMNRMMKQQLSRYPVKTAMILGVAGGNGLEHIDPQKLQKVYGVDINRAYLRECAARYPELKGVLECICADLTAPDAALPHAELVIANLLVEYIGYPCFQRAVTRIRPAYVSCIIQINVDDSFVSDSPYLHVFDGLAQVHRQMREGELTAALESVGYRLTTTAEHPLPNGKKLVQLDFTR